MKMESEIGTPFLLGEFFVATLLVTGFFLLYSSGALGASKPCDAVDVLAEVYFSPEDLLSIGVYGDKKRKYCQFSINGATKESGLKISGDISNTLENLRFLRSYARGELSSQKASDFTSVVGEATSTLLYLIAAPRLEDRRPPDKLAAIWKKNDKLVQECLFIFYSGKAPTLKSDVMSCGLRAGSKRILFLRVEYGSFYELLIFR